jgi:hypothetical protein
VWNKMLTFSTVGAIAEHVRAGSGPDETIMGASTLAPLVALYADRRIAADEADTNAKRFSAGVLTDEALFDAACADGVRFVVVAGRSHFTEDLMSGNPVASASFRLDRTFVDSELVHFRGFPISLYRRVDRPGLPAGRVCGGP